MNVEYYLILLIGLLLIGLIIFDFKSGFFSPIFLTSVYLFFGFIIRFFVLESKLDYYEDTYWNRISGYIETILNDGITDIAIAIIVMAGSYSLFKYLIRNINLEENNFLKVFYVDYRDLSYNRILFVCLGSLVVYLFGIAFTQGGLINGFTTLQKRSLIFGSELLYLRLFLVLSSIACAFLYYQYVVDLKKNFVKFFVTHVVIISNLIVLFLAGSRGKMLTQIFILSFVWIQYNEKKKLNILKIGFIVIISALIIITGMIFRVKAQYDIPINEAAIIISQSGVKTISDSIPLLDLYMGAKYYADVVGYDNGLQFLQYPLRLIPRDIWENKPIIYGLKIREFYYGHTQSGAPPTVFGEFYISFALIGSFVCGVFIGSLIAFLNKLYLISKKDPGYGLIYIVLVIQFVFSSIRAGLEMALFNLLYMISWILFVRFFASKNLFSMNILIKNN